jgi:hypothetical protein
MKHLPLVQRQRIIVGSDGTQYIDQSAEILERGGFGKLTRRYPVPTFEFISVPVRRPAGMLMARA